MLIEVLIDHSGSLDDLVVFCKAPSASILEKGSMSDLEAQLDNLAQKATERLRKQASFIPQNCL